MVFYTKHGEGQPLILLHSGGMNHTEWDPQIPLLSKHFSLYVIDLPGHGKTPLRGEKLSIHECGEAVLEVMAKENLDSAYICGSSMGGATALWLTINHPSKVKRLMLYRANYHKSQDGYERTLQMGDPKHWERLGIAKIMSKMHLGQGDADSWKTVITRVSDALNPATTDHGYTLEQLAEIDIPVLILCGDRDPLVPLQDLCDMYKAIPKSSLWIMPHASHITGTNTWRDSIFAEEIYRFLHRTRPIKN